MYVHSTGMDHNFDKYADDFITDQNTPYDYESIMHYGPYSFNKDPRYPTITAKDPEMTKVLGQYNDFSSLDLLRLNRMYNCCESFLIRSHDQEDHNFFPNHLI